MGRTASRRRDGAARNANSTSSHRFDVDGGVYHAMWRDPILVRCPACGDCGRVRRFGEAWRVACEACGFAQTAASAAAPHPWRGPIYLRAWKRCSRCGARIDGLRKAASVPARLSRTFRCRGCGTPNLVPLQWYPATLPAAATDPYFGLPLWLQVSSAGKRLWAYNRAHLGILKRYVGAGLRERQPNHNRSLVSRLPTWIKLAKYRDRILKSLDDLRDMLPDHAARRGPGSNRATKAASPARMSRNRRTVLRGNWRVERYY